MDHLGRGVVDLFRFVEKLKIFPLLTFLFVFLICFTWTRSNPNLKEFGNLFPYVREGEGEGSETKTTIDH